MTKRTDRLLKEIEAGALDSKTSISELLRKAISLGGDLRSAEMRDWAARELHGYGADDELLQYRQITAPLQVDTIDMHRVFRDRTISSMELPDFARDKITEDLHLRMGIADIEHLARSEDVVRLSPPGSQDLVVLMNASGEYNAHIQRLFWGVSPVALRGVLQHVRTALTVMVSDIRANSPEGADTPSPEVATNAVTLAVTGKRNKINVATHQSGAAMTTTAPEESRRWLKITGAVLGGLVAIAAAIFTLMQVQGWSF